MKHLIISSAIKTLEKSQLILRLLSNEEFTDDSVGPYYSSIGSHFRHILDFFDCILSFENVIDLTKRKRQVDVEKFCSSAEEYLSIIIKRLKCFDKDLNAQVYVVDDLGLGKIQISYTYSALLAQANSHTIHHYAIINYILNGLNIKLEDEMFGFNPTSPKKSIN